MSICALLLMGTLLGVLGGQNFLDTSDELGSIVDDFRVLATMLLTDGSEAELIWEVPFTASGESIIFVLAGEVISASTLDRTAVENVTCAIHTWRWDGSDMNLSRAEELDLGSPPLRTSSGQSVVLSSIFVVLDNEQVLALFAWSE